MPVYVIERTVPGASQLTDEELRGITATSNEVVEGFPRPYAWRHSYGGGGKIYGGRGAETAEDAREHGRRGGFPVDLVAEVARVFDSTGPREMPV